MVLDDFATVDLAPYPLDSCVAGHVFPLPPGTSGPPVVTCTGENTALFVPETDILPSCATQVIRGAMESE